ncbi:uncharacterized protein LOC120342097 [Styela clava]
MASNPPAKIVLKSSTKVSLNDRFSTIMKTQRTTSQTVRAQMSNERMASEKNRRLAQQMERRPAVAAALDNKPVSIRDRLGSPPARGRRGIRGGRFQSRGQFVRGGRGRGGFPSPRGNSLNRGRNPGRRGFIRPTRTGRGRGTGMRGRGRGISRGRGRGGRQGRGGANRREPADKDKLDEQLDSYMTKTKGAMNAELDSYMAEINN